MFHVIIILKDEGKTTQKVRIHIHTSLNNSIGETVPSFILQKRNINTPKTPEILILSSLIVKQDAFQCSLSYKILEIILLLLLFGLQYNVMY